MSDWIFRLRVLPYVVARPEKLRGRCPRCRITVLDTGRPADPNRCLDRKCPPLEPIKEAA